MSATLPFLFWALQYVGALFMCTGFGGLFMCAFYGYNIVYSKWQHVLHLHYEVVFICAVYCGMIYIHSI